MIGIAAEPPTRKDVLAIRPTARLASSPIESKRKRPAPRQGKRGEKHMDGRNGITGRKTGKRIVLILVDINIPTI